METDINNYRSGFEARIGKQLDEAGVEYLFEEVVIEYNQFQHNCFCSECHSDLVFKERDYLTDFYLKKKKMYLETKGKFTSQDRTKMLAIINGHPELDIRMVFMRDNWITKKKKAKYSDWCNRHNIKYAIGKVPEEWINK
jgi:hypothetical protein